MESLLTGNPYFSAGFGLIGITAGLAILRKGAVHGVTMARRKLLVSLEIPSKDHSYSWFLQWMTANNARNLAASTGQLARGPARPHQLAIQTTFTRHENGSSSTEFLMVPGRGKHFFEYKGAWFQVERQREQSTIDLTTGSPCEIVTVTTLSRDRALLSQILEEAKEVALASDVGKTVIYTSFGPEWRKFGNPRRRRPLDTVVLDQDTSSIIYNDIKAFLAGGSWYHTHGVPYRRGYLLYGPPGSGKTSYIQSLAGELGYNICILNLGEMGMTDDRLAHLLNNIPARSIILLEDVDAAFPSRTAVSNDPNTTHVQTNSTRSMLTFSGLLNALDGVAAAEERIIFMTTNHMDRLDNALVRPGRVDVRAYIGNATELQARAMFLRFYDGQVDLADQFTKVLVERGAIGNISPAQLQGHFVIHRKSAQRALDRIDMLLDNSSQ
ncbi:hypothetical protein BATDEDRAFT_30890 [Batrachochytrium dendrobatidis JAM81]|uniref:Mitochondrial chaperone BCS1 n=1 Tax=Batrachochytrium dendrobatidis (strain JAM81 / FGSC 10211) TaxID=684364 RepID=F4PDT3_BATDJ|nr:bifunctional AAA family ATPase chaperone/translocase BCS1 [Batrachochytrium dendrobatidis JAM81]EGF76556.1 hypothetical protein BATDEDRAFT_30890 [Batrachochytrium dendrobatidis JAM81]|eukprot:XP_006682843.1 hypothetical protein BATDEDRAFT_30890 [Batrachochytrium dendrobatidis JAM81]